MKAGNERILTWSTAQQRKSPVHVKKIAVSCYWRNLIEPCPRPKWGQCQ